MASSSRRGAHETEEDAGPSYGGPSQGWTALEERLFKRIDDMEVQANSRHEENLRNNEEIRNQIRLLTEHVAHMESQWDQGGPSKPTPRMYINFPSPSDEDEEAARKNRLGLNKKGGDDDEEGPRGGDLDYDDDDIEKGDDSEHVEIITDDDEAVGNDHEKREDLAPEIPSPPEIKQALKSTTAGTARGTQSTSNSSNGKRKSNGDESNTTPNDAPHKKVKTVNDVESVKEVPGSSAKSSAPTKGATPQASSKSASAPPTGPVTEEEIKAMFLPKRPVTMNDLLNKFKSRLELKEEKDAFTAVLNRIARIHKTDWANYVLLREKPGSSAKSSAPTEGATPRASSKSAPAPPTGPVTEEEVKAMFLQKRPVTMKDILAKFMSRVQSKEEKEAFAATMNRLTRIHRTDWANYVLLRERPGSSAKSSVPTEGATPQASSKSAPEPVTEEEIKPLFLQRRPVTMKDLVAKFESRLQLKEEQDALFAILKRIAVIHRTEWADYLVLRER